MPIITDPEKIQLVLETLGIEGIKAGELAYDRLEKQIKEIEKAEGTLVQQTKNLTATEHELVKVIDETAAKAKTLGTTISSGGDFGRNILQGSYAVQDFTSQLGTRGLAGALGAVQNNIPGLLQGLLSPATIGAVSILAVGAGLLYENWNKIAAAFRDTTKITPELEDQLKKIKERKEELLKIGDLTNIEMREYNKLIGEQKQLEKELEEQQEAKKKKKQEEQALGKAGVQTETEAAKERAENLQLTVGAQQREFEVDIFKGGAIGQRGAAAQAQLVDQIQRLPPGEERDNLLRQLTMIKKAAAPGADRYANVRDLMARGIGGGDLNAINALQRLLPKDSQFRGMIAAVQPEAMEQAAGAEQEAIDWGERQHRGAGKFRRAYQQRIEQDKIAKMLTEQGRQGEAEMWADKAREDEQTARHTAQAGKKAAQEQAHAQDSSNKLRAMQEAVRDQVTRMALANRPPDFNPEMVGDWVRQALEDLPQNMNNIPSALQQAMWEVRMHIRRMGEQNANQWNKMNGMQFNQPAGFGVGQQ